MKKFKFKNIFMFSFLVLCIIPINVKAYDVSVTNEDGLKIYYNFINDKNELCVTYYSLEDYWYQGTIYRNAEAYDGNIKIPNEVSYEGKVYKVSEIGENAFYHCRISIEMPDYLKSVHSTAFSTASIKVIKASDFRIWCETDFGGTNPFIIANKVIINDKDFELPSELNINCSKIGCNAFKGIDQIKKVTMTESVENIGNAAFKDCGQLSSVVIGNSVTLIDENAFAGCSRLASLKMSNSVITIGNNAFSGCDRLYNVQISNSLQHIGDKAFYSTPITNLELPNSLLYIGESAFEHCKELVSINIPPNVNYIGASAFDWCSNLSSEIVIPDNVKIINRYIFSYCSKIPLITLGNSIEKICHGAFWACYNLKLKSEKLPNSLREIEESAFGSCRSIETVDIPNSVKIIGDEAFDGAGLKKVILGNAIESIGHKAFGGLNTVISKMEDPCDIFDDTFGSYEYVKNMYGEHGVTLFVPKGTKELYQHTKGWKKFKNIVESELANIIINVNNDTPIKSNIYSLNGYKQQYLKSGINIIRMNDGTSKKVVLK